MKHSIVLVFSLLSPFAVNAADRSAAAAVFSNADVSNNTALTGVMPSLPGAAEADTKASHPLEPLGRNTATVLAPNWYVIANEVAPKWVVSDPSALERAIAQGQVNTPYANRCALVWAITYRNLDMLRKLLAAGANPNYAQQYGHTPLGTCIDILHDPSFDLSEGEQRILKTMIFELLNAGAQNLARGNPDGNLGFSFFANADAFFMHLFDVGALILEHGASGEDQFQATNRPGQMFTLTDLAALNEEEIDSKRHYAKQAVLAGSQGRQARNACLASWRKTIRAALKPVLLPELVRIVLDYAPPSCPHVHFTAFTTTLDYPLIKEDEWRKQKPGTAVASGVNEISVARWGTERAEPIPVKAPQGCCTVS